MNKDINIKKERVPMMEIVNKFVEDIRKKTF